MPATLSLLLSLLLLISGQWWCAAAAAAGDGGSAGVVAGGELWCVAKNNAEDGPLQAALDWACGPGGADCGAIQQGGPCFDPNDVQDHASYAFNNYFLRRGSAPDACDFSGTAALTSLNPSQNNCTFPSSSSARNGSFSGGVGPAGADMSGAASSRFSIWKQTSTVVVLAASTALASGIFR